MRLEWVRRYCMAMPHVTEEVLWGNDLVFKTGGKMFATLVLEPQRVCLAFKCSPADFVELVERPNIIPAPYSARAYALIFAKLPRRVQAELSETVNRISRTTRSK